MIDRDKFFAGMRAWGKLTQSQVGGLNDLLDFFENDGEMSDVRWQAYALATVKHEAANTYKPIAEYGKGKGKPYGKADPETGQKYYGRGYVQVTWKRNYQVMSDLIGVDLVTYPDFAMEPQTAYAILSHGMTEGLFTGKKLRHYISGAKTDYLNARKIINAMDKAALIAGYAKRFETILNESISNEPILNGEVTEPAPEAAPVETETITEKVVTKTVETPGSTVVEKISSTASTLAANESVKSIASEGVGKLATKVVGTLGTAGAGATAGAATASNPWPWIVLVIVCLLLAAGIVFFWLKHKSDKEAKAADIAADKTKSDISFAK